MPENAGIQIIRDCFKDITLAHEQNENSSKTVKKSEHAYRTTNVESENADQNLPHTENSNRTFTTIEDLMRKLHEQQRLPMGQGPRVDQRSKQARNSCQKCGGSNNTRDCRRVRSDTECYNCGRKGHMGRVCRNTNDKFSSKPNNESSDSVYSDLTPTKTSAILDTGSTISVVNHPSLLQPAEKICQPQIKTVAGITTAEQSGNSLLQVKDTKNSAHTLIIPDVFISSAPENLISIDSLLDSGSQVILDHNPCVILKDKSVIPVRRQKIIVHRLGRLERKSRKCISMVVK